MSWEWSHTNEAYAYARDQIHELSLKQLIEITAEWRAWNGDLIVPVLNLEHHDNVLESLNAEPPSNESLAEYIWEQASELSTCDNGGFNAYICPFGCHTVPFGPEHE